MRGHVGELFQLLIGAQEIPRLLCEPKRGLVSIGDIGKKGDNAQHGAIKGFMRSINRFQVPLTPTPANEAVLKAGFGA